MLETIKIKLLKLLINSIFKYNSDECKDKWMETTIDDIKYLIEQSESQWYNCTLILSQ